LSTRLHSTAPTAERAVLVGAELPKARIHVEESIAELARLAGTAGLAVVGRAIAPLRRIQPATYPASPKASTMLMTAIAARNQTRLSRTCQTAMAARATIPIPR
jgi:50S ribosomal subunit-associated GTPase HflX